MSHLFGQQPKVIPEFTGLQVNTAVQVLPIPIVYGSPRANLNVIYYNGFQALVVKQGGGKGILSGGKGGNEQVEYFATFAGAFSEGPIGDPLIIYDDGNVWTPATFPSNGAEWFNGSATQAPWTLVETNWPSDARGYKNTSYYAFGNAQIDSSATIPQLGIVAQGFFQGTSPLNYSVISITSGQYNPDGTPQTFIGDITLGFADADPALVIYDFLTNPTYGATFPTQWIDTTTLFTQANGYDPNTGDATLSSFCQAVGLAWSLAVDNAEAASSILERWCKNLNTAVFWDGALLRFVPYWDSPASANPGWDARAGLPMKYYTPYTVPITAITLDHILQADSKEDDPIFFMRKDPQEVYNTVRLDFRDRTNFFNDVPAEAKDEAHLELYGPRIDNIGLGSEFSLAAYAQQSVMMNLRRNISIMRTYSWKMSPLWGWLNPMDILEIPDPTNYSNTIIVRITNLEDDEDENVTITAEEYPVGSQSPSVMPLSPTTPPNTGATNSPPASAFPPVIFAPTTLMLEAQGIATPQVLVACSAGRNNVLDTNYGGCFVWTSLDNISYQLLGTIVGPSIVGSLSTSLPGFGGINPDTGDTLLVNLNESDGVMPSFSATAAAAGASLCVMQDGSGFELISYTTATLTGPFTYALTGLYRGLYGTTSRFFGAGSKFAFISGTNTPFLEVPLPPAYVGMTFYVKLQGFNVFNQAPEDLSEVTVYEYVATGPTPTPPTPPAAMQPATFRRRPTTIKAPVPNVRHKRYQ